MSEISIKNKFKLINRKLSKNNNESTIYQEQIIDPPSITSSIESNKMKMDVKLNKDFEDFEDFEDLEDLEWFKHGEFNKVKTDVKLHEDFKDFEDFEDFEDLENLEWFKHGEFARDNVKLKEIAKNFEETFNIIIPYHQFNLDSKPWKNNFCCEEALDILGDEIKRKITLRSHLKSTFIKNNLKLFSIISSKIFNNILSQNIINEINKVNKEHFFHNKNK